MPDGPTENGENAGDFDARALVAQLEEELRRTGPSHRSGASPLSPTSGRTTTHCSASSTTSTTRPTGSAPSSMLSEPTGDEDRRLRAAGAVRARRRRDLRGH